jgi:hypothetical protein
MGSAPGLCITMVIHSPKSLYRPTPLPVHDQMGPLVRLTLWLRLGLLENKGDSGYTDDGDWPCSQAGDAIPAASRTSLAPSDLKRSAATDMVGPEIAIVLRLSTLEISSSPDRRGFGATRIEAGLSIK